MVSYQKILLQYSQCNSCQCDYITSSVSQEERRLRWLKHEANGNSANPTTEFNVRRSHIMNRRLQMTLEKDVLFYTKYHGVYCRDVERMQKKLWCDQLNRDRIVGKTCLTGPDILQRFHQIKNRNRNPASKTQVDKYNISLISNMTGGVVGQGSGDEVAKVPYSEPTDWVVHKQYSTWVKELGGGTDGKAATPGSAPGSGNYRRSGLGYTGLSAVQ